MISDRLIVEERHFKIAKEIKSSVKKGDIVLVYGTSGTGKCLGKGTEILMFNGTFKKVENINVNDLLMAHDSSCTKVKSIISGTSELYEIQQNRGENYVVNSEHVLSLRTYINKKEKYYNISVKDYLNLSNYNQLILKGYKTKKLKFPIKKQPVEPYFLGLWLGDGRSDSQPICTMDKEIYGYLYDYAKRLGMHLSVYDEKRSEKTNSYSLTSKTKKNFILNFLRKKNLINNKHIPDIYKYNSQKSRLELLAGLLDSDGYLDRNSCFEITTKFPKLKNDILFLARSLGFYCSCNIKKILKYPKNIYYRINISGNLDKIPTKLKRKQAGGRLQIKNHLVTGIKIKKLGVGIYYGFSLEGNKKKFLLKDLTITHNSEVSDCLQGELFQKKLSSLVLSLDDFYLIHPTIRNFNRKKLGLESVGLIEIDWEYISRICQDFNDKKPIYFRRVHKYADVVEHNTIDSDDVDVLIIEGLYAGYMKNYGYGDYSIYLEGNPSQTLPFRQRRKKEDSNNEFRKKVVNKEFNVISQLKKFADKLIPFEEIK